MNLITCGFNPFFLTWCLLAGIKPGQQEDPGNAMKTENPEATDDEVMVKLLLFSLALFFIAMILSDLQGR